MNIEPINFGRGCDDHGKLMDGPGYLPGSPEDKVYKAAEWERGVRSRLSRVKVPYDRASLRAAITTAVVDASYWAAERAQRALFDRCCHRWR